VRDTDEKIERFLAELREHAHRKRALYDGVDNLRAVGQLSDSPDVWLRMLIEEVGEVAGALTRQRYALAIEECRDVAHCAMLLQFAIKEMTS
jgi:hypothetical protein